jgi:hypothetical protein
VFRAAPAGAPAPGKPAAGAVGEGDGSGVSGVAARMLDSSVLRGVVTSSQRRAIEQELGGILDELAFTADQRSRFLDLLVAGQAAVVEASLRRMSGQLSAADETELDRRIEAANDEVLAQSEAFFAREFPGQPEKFAAFQRHAALAPDRAEVAALQPRLVAAGRALTPAQERDLAGIFHDVRTAVVPALDPGEVSQLTLDAATLAPRIRDQQRIDALLRTKVAAVLDPAQVALLAEHQADRLKPYQRIVDLAPKSAPPGAK